MNANDNQGKTATQIHAIKSVNIIDQIDLMTCPNGTLHTALTTNRFKP